MALKDDLNILGRFLVKEVRDELKTMGIDSTGELSQSVNHVVKDTLFGFSLEIRYLDYGVFVNTGRKAGGKKIPIQALQKWIKDKGLGQGFKKDRSFAFAIQTNAFKFGLKPKPFQDNVIKNNIRVITKSISKSITKSLEAIITDMVNDTQRNLNAIR